MKRTLGILAIATIASTSALAAQQHNHPPGSDSAQGMMMSHDMQQGMMMGMMGNMDMMKMMPAHGAFMQAMRFNPMMVSMRAEELGLTAAQVAAIGELSEQMRPMDGDPVQSDDSFEQLSQLLQAERPDTAAIRTLAIAVHHWQSRGFAQMLVSAAVVRNLLTAEQREMVLSAPMMPMMQMMMDRPEDDSAGQEGNHQH